MNKIRENKRCLHSLSLKSDNMKNKRSSTFNLKHPKADKKTTINFSAYFRNESRKFVYSTGETIHPSDWDFYRCEPKFVKGNSEKAIKLNEIHKQIKRYSTHFQEVVSMYQRINEDVDIETMRNEFNNKFKKTKSRSNNFFAVYDMFLDEMIKDKTPDANAKSTIDRYRYLKNMLKEFELKTNTKLHLNRINKSFYNSFIEFSVEEKIHYDNTLRRNVGLLKTFLNWALKNRYTYKSDFITFKSPKGYVTDEIALTLEQVRDVYNFDFKDNTDFEKVRDLFVFGCATGMRFSNYSIVGKKDIQSDYIYAIDVKDKTKILHIPLNIISSEILRKYNFNLPIFTLKTFNEKIKDVFEEIGFNKITKKILRIGNRTEEQFIPMYKRISSHTARRSFITIMKNKRVPDKVIMEITGHKSVDIFNKYYKPNNEEKKTFMNDVWQSSN
jgi:integrase